MPPRDLEVARRHFERALQIYVQVYGTREDYSTAIAEEALRRLLEELGDSEAGSKILAHAYSALREKLGESHRYTKDLAANLKKR